MSVAPARHFSLGAELHALAPEEQGAAAAFLADHPPGLGAPLAIVIPAYNEAPSVAGVLEEIPAEAGGLRTEVIVVVDGAEDATAARAHQAGAFVCDVPVNRGQGAALKLGYWLARVRGAQLICTIDADGQYDPEEIGRVIEPILAQPPDPPLTAPYEYLINAPTATEMPVVIEQERVAVANGKGVGL